MKKYTIILFDIDDTLLDFKKAEHSALHNTFMEHDMPTGFADTHASYRKISEVLWHELEQGRMAIRELGIERFKRLFLEHELDISADTFSKLYLENLGKETHIMPGAEELLESLDDCRLAIITNGFGEVQKSRIQNSPFNGRFEHLIISEETGFQKPHKGIFDYAFEKLGLSSKEGVLIVGDSLTSDIQGGADYGIDTCWYNPFGKKNTTGIRPTYEIRELLELGEIINGNKTEKNSK
ncbi:YjjG family noncanonical pyrimidine nucleotidase [Planococcus shenhongbingii]|uniref:YjjG family noncanonical pyrimidine nucleotidase n=1 Tax=Planococcus shenhongbingii TaxID=3058398 RepID=UPI00260EA297|nr:YjjG family noncanonical pyrimidine nucleotidase [Planococcus sp. N016]WKA57105.1 YjjG family noncanonical pyrimidine nucleotidase [Planococcus sp. N016]